MSSAGVKQPKKIAVLLVTSTLTDKDTSVNYWLKVVCPRNTVAAMQLLDQ